MAAFFYDAVVSDPSEEEYRGFAAKVDALPRSSKVWVLPIYRALAESGGAAKPRDVEKHIRAQTKHLLSKEQWAYALKSKSIRFARNELRKLGGISSEQSGLWQWSPVGERYWRDFEGKAIVVPEGLPELSAEESQGVDEPLETVEVTAREGYDIPILRVLSREACRRGEVFAKLESVGHMPLLPGDRRLTRQQNPVYTRGAGWTLSHLKSEGLVRNPSHGMWEITNAGRERLKREDDTWHVDLFRGAQARVRPLASQEEPTSLESIVDAPSSGEEDHKRPDWDVARWKECKSHLTAYTAVHRRLRPDLGPTPDNLRAPIPRNLLLYGPPGTGKTYTASMIAAALTGEPEPSDDGLFRILQFHPSYAYEDFVQGLRPDLTRSGIHYRVDPGPLRRICDEASEDPDHFYVLVIDEINRGDPARIFGEALLALEYRGKAISLPIGTSLVIPPNLVVLGTMNSVDRSIALMDYALRRRFGFVYLAPDLDVVRKHFPGSKAAKRAIEAVGQLNRWLENRVGREHVIGHSFLLNPAYPADERRSLSVLWDMDIRPLLEEYLFHDRNGFVEICDSWAEWTANNARTTEESDDST